MCVWFIPLPPLGYQNSTVLTSAEKYWACPGFHTQQSQPGSSLISSLSSRPNLSQRNSLQNFFSILYSEAIPTAWLGPNLLNLQTALAFPSLKGDLSQVSRKTGTKPKSYFHNILLIFLVIAPIDLYHVKAGRKSNHSSSYNLISANKLIKDKFPFPAASRAALVHFVSFT